MKRILGIGGSPRKGGNSDILISSILKAAGDEVKTETVQLRDFDIHPCIGCEKCRKDDRCTGLKDGMQLIYPKIEEAKGLVLVSPIYSYNVTAQMKSFIDRLYGFYYFAEERPGYWSSRLAGQGRKAVIAAIGEQDSPDGGGMDLTLEVMRRSVTALGYEIVGELPVLGVFAKGKIREQPQTLKAAEEMGRKLASALQAV